MAGLKRCVGCEQHLLPDQFSKKSSRCKPCASAYSARWRLLNPEKARRAQKEWRQRSHAAERIEGYRIKYRYGLTIEDRDALREKQGDSCAICRHPFDAAPHIDHCHATGKIRGLLCDRCNRGIGYFKDDPERLRAAALYVEGNH